MPETHRQQVMSVEEGLDNLDEPTQIVDCFTKKYKPVTLKVKPVLGTLPKRFRITREIIGDLLKNMPSVTNFIWPYLHQFSIDSHGLNGYGEPLKRPFYRYQSRLEAINNGRDIRQINW